MKRILSFLEISLIILIALAPLMASFPYRNNIFLSWEGSYRLYLGQIPYKDFGMPVGYMYWVVPALFFKLFGPYMITLIKAQAFINIISGLAFRSIFKSLQLDPAIRFIGVLVFCLSYSFFNYWPWYNHTVIVYELVALAFLMKSIFATNYKWANGWAVLSGIFVFISFFTKQDAGGLAFLLCMALLIYDSFTEKRWWLLLAFLIGLVVSACLLILPVSGSSFGYWFNYGQSPHHSRISIPDILSEFFAASQWIKFYFLLMGLILLGTIRQLTVYLREKPKMIFSLLTLGILVQATILQVTSYVPENNNIFFHSFAIIFILFSFSQLVNLRLDQWKPLLAVSAGVLLWWSQVYYKYIDRFILKQGKQQSTSSTYNGYTYADVVNSHTYMIEMDTTAIPLSQWRQTNLPTLRKILVPGPTADGIDRLLNMSLVKTRKDLKVLNLTELTSLAAEIPFTLEKGSEYPLWYHKGVAVFDRETKLFKGRIQQHYYDLVLFEYIPYLNNFYPFELRQALQDDYQLVDRFVAPRNPSFHAWIEVYVRK